MIKKIDKITVGTKRHVPMDTNNPPLSFMTPFGDDDAYKKRLSTLSSWCGKGYYEHNYETKESKWIDTPEKLHYFENIPLAGFKVNESVSRWSTSNKWFRIADPRGFAVEISADNLCTILLHCNVEKGIIKDECIWCRENGINVLVPTNSEDYKKAIEGTKVANRKKISNKDLKFGYIYKSLSYKKVYLGKVKIYGKNKLIFANTSYNMNDTDNAYLYGIDDVSSHSFIYELDKVKYLEKILQNTIKKYNGYAENYRKSLASCNYWHREYNERSLKESLFQIEILEEIIKGNYNNDK